MKRNPGSRPRRTPGERAMEREIRGRLRKYVGEVTCHCDPVLATFFTYWPRLKVSIPTPTMREGLMIMALFIEAQFSRPARGREDA